MIDNPELKAREEEAKQDLLFFSLHYERLLLEGWVTKEELENSINEALDDLIELKKLKEQ